MRQVTLYSRARCGLCDEARAVLVAQQAKTPFELREVDIDTDDALIKEYGIRIPVVDIDGEEAFEITVDPRGLASLLEGK